MPAEHRSNFRHLVYDIGWFGLLNGSALAFMVIFATRQGATALEIGLLNAGPAVVNLLVTIPFGRWLRRRPLQRSVVQAALWHRSGYLLWVVLPFLLIPGLQIWLLLAAVLLMSIPGAALAISFNGLLAAAVPPEWRGLVIGRRNAAFAAMSILTSLLCGAILTYLPFSSGYALVFFLGFLGAAMSTWHLTRIVLQDDIPNSDKAPANPPMEMRLSDLARPGLVQTFGVRRLAVAPRLFLRRLRTSQIIAAAPGYRLVLAGLFFFHFAQYFGIPLFPLYYVNTLELSDRVISFGTSLFYLMLFVFSMRLAPMSQRLGHYRLTIIGAFLMGLYPIILSFSQGATGFYFASATGGLAWAIAGGSLGNYLFEFIPEDDRAPYMAGYNLFLHGAILSGSFLAPVMIDLIGLQSALWASALLRIGSGLVIAVLGRMANRATSSA